MFGTHESKWGLLAAAGVVISACSISLWTGQCAVAGPAEDGISLFKAKRYAEARTAFEKAFAQKKSDPNILYYYALTLQQTGDTAKARATYQQIVNAFPETGAAVYARQALGLPPAPVKTGTATPGSTAVSQSKQPLPFGCPVSMLPGATLEEATDTPALLYRFKSIKLRAITTPEKVIEFYEHEMARDTNWKLREKTPVVKQPRPDLYGNVMFGEITYLNKKSGDWNKELTISTSGPEGTPTADHTTFIEITLFNEVHFENP